MYRVGIVGHTIEHFLDPDAAKRLICRTMDTLSYQYDNQIVYNIPGNIGTGLWAANKCLEESYKYHLFCPFPLETTIEHWYDDQKEDLTRAFSYAYALSVMETERKSVNIGNMVNERIVDDSNFVVAFWMGKKQGHTFETIKYALESNKLILNGCKNLRLITNNDLRKSKHGRQI